MVRRWWSHKTAEIKVGWCFGETGICQSAACYRHYGHYSAVSEGGQLHEQLHSSTVQGNLIDYDGMLLWRDKYLCQRLTTQLIIIRCIGIARCQRLNCRCNCPWRCCTVLRLILIETCVITTALGRLCWWCWYYIDDAVQMLMCVNVDVNVEVAADQTTGMHDALIEDDQVEAVDDLGSGL